MAHDEQEHVDGWRTYSDWLDDIRDNNLVIRGYDDNLDFRQSLLSCKSNTERFKLIWTDDKLRNEIKSIFNEDSKYSQQKVKSRKPKSIEGSKRLRELGNKSFKEGNYLEALNYYTQAIKLSPPNSFSPPKATLDKESAKEAESEMQTKDDTLALALANRSAALFAMNRFRLCMLDIDLAIKYGYPEVNMFKLRIRKLKCLHILSVWANDVEEIKEDLGRIARDPSTKPQVKTEIANMFEFLKQTKPENFEIDELDVVDEIAMRLTNGAKRIPHCADCVEMSYVEDKGRFLMVNKDCSIGRLMVAEEPYVCNLAPSKRNDYCYHCFAKLHSCGLSCSNCTQISYCSESCLEMNRDAHRWECNKFLDFQDKIGVAYLVSHVIFKLNFDTSQKFPMCTKKITDNKSIEEILKMEPMDCPDYVYRNDYASVLALNDHANDYHYHDLMGHSLTATYLLIGFMDLLSKTDFDHLTKVLKTEEQQLFLGSLILRHLLQMQTNLISILDQNLQNVVAVGHEISEMEEHPIGIGIYPTVSLMNHSCRPNIMSIFHRNKFVGRASQPLPCGTELKYCYGPSVSRMTKKDRQQRLKEQYFFNCNCECCSSNQENESRALLCPKCNGPIIYNQDFTHGCLKCNSSDAIDVKVRLKQIEDLHNQIDLLKNSDSHPGIKIEKLNMLEEKLKKLAYWKHPNFVSIKSSMSEYAQEMDDIEAGLKYCEEELELCDRTYGIDSYVSIMTKLKIINLKWQNLYNHIEFNCNTIAEKENGLDDLRALVTTIMDTRVKLRDLLSATNIKGADSSFETEIGFLNTVQRNIVKYLKATEEEIKQPEVVEPTQDTPLQEDSKPIDLNSKKPGPSSQ